MKVLPTPTGPRIKALWPASTKRREHSSSQTGSVEADLGGGVPVLQAHVGVESGGAGPQGGGGGLAAGDLVGEDQLEELGVAQFLGLGQRQPFGEGVEAAAQLDLRAGPSSARPRCCGCRGGHAAIHRSALSAASGFRRRKRKSSAGRAKRGEQQPALDGDLRRCGASVARSIIRPISPTLNASASAAGRRRSRPVPVPTS